MLNVITAVWQVRFDRISAIISVRTGHDVPMRVRCHQEGKYSRKGDNINKKHFTIIVCLATLFMAACAPSPQAIQTAVAGTQAALPTQTAYPTHTPYPTYTIPPAVIVTKIVTETFTPSPLFTPTITSTPTKTLPPSKTPNLAATTTAQQLAYLRANKPDNNYLVGIDIAPGVWRNNSTGDSCYWETSTRTGDIINHYFGPGGGTVYIGSTNFAFLSKRCGVWTFLSPP